MKLYQTQHLGAPLDLDGTYPIYFAREERYLGQMSAYHTLQEKISEPRGDFRKARNSSTEGSGAD